jgi:hypothetical protein
MIVPWRHLVAMESRSMMFLLTEEVTDSSHRNQGFLAIVVVPIPSSAALLFAGLAPAPMLGLVCPYARAV